MRGIDVSHYQGSIDWTSVAGGGIEFAMAKATEGTDYVDPTFSKNFQGMLWAGIIRGAYHYAHPASDATTQADFFVDAVIAAGGFNASKTLQLVLDLEDADGQDTATVWTWVQTWAARIKVLTGRAPILYTGYYFWNDNVGAPSDNLDMPLWIASYSSPAPVGIPSAWAELGWAFWQYDDNGASEPGGSSGTIPGIAGNSVDVDYFMNSGAYPSLSALCFA
jgi:lysozyme